jgi:hypothetical protein
MTPAIETLNALVAELDAAMGYQLDWVTSPVWLVRAAEAWHGCRRGLAGELARAFDEVEREARSISEQ